MKNRVCEVCGGQDKKVLFRQEFSPVEGASLFDGYDVVVCRGCGFGFADDIPPQATFDAYYRDLSKYEYDQRAGAESPFDLARFRQNVEEMRELIPSREAAILEIGCSTGRLLALLRDAGFANVRGLDPSPSCASGAKRLYGLEVATGTLADSAALGRNFDFVVGNALLEHIRDLGEALGRIHSLLRPNGLLFVEVPDVLGFSGVRDSPYQQFSIEHVDFFSPTSLRNLMLTHDFEPVRVWEAARQGGPGYTMPVAAGVFRAAAGTASPSAAWRPDTGTEPALLDYIAYSQRLERGLRDKIGRLAADQTPLLVWGVGTHTQRLLATSRLREARIQAFVDSNSKYRARTIAGVPIIGPGDVAGRPEAILVSSFTFQTEIERQIKEELGLPNEVILLYEN